MYAAFSKLMIDKGLKIHTVLYAEYLMCLRVFFPFIAQPFITVFSHTQWLLHHDTSLLSVSHAVTGHTSESTP